MECAICLDDTAQDEFLRLPGCGHAFHVKCALQNAQYNAKCPVCRALPVGVVERAGREAETPVVTLDPSSVEQVDGRIIITFDTVDDTSTEDVEAMDRYNARRRRALRTNSALARADRLMREAQDETQRKQKALDRVYERLCRDIWRGDPDVRFMRNEVRKTQRRAKRYEREVEQRLNNLLNPPEP